MSGQWKEVARLHFKGERFRDHALDLSAVTELRQFQKMVAETAKALWRAAYPDRERLPAHFEERTRLCLRRIENGSATVPLEVYMEAPQQGELWGAEPEEMNKAIELAFDVFDSLENDRPLPDRLPKELVPEYAEWGKTLGTDESIELETPAKQRTTSLHGRSRERWSMFNETPHTSHIEISGEVLEADVRQRRFQVWIDASSAVSVVFDETQEGLVTQSLRDHRSIRMRVSGYADISPLGKPIRFSEVSSLELISPGQPSYDPGAPKIEDEIARIAAGVPARAWDRLPKDLNDNLDHYLYDPPSQ